MTAIAFTIFGECASKANSRRLVPSGTRDPLTGEVHACPRVIKSGKALAFVRSALKQIPPSCRVRLETPVCLRLTLYYASARPDLDEALLIDALQDQWVSIAVGGEHVRVLGQRGVLRNDRQVWEKHVYKRIDRLNPRVEVVVEPLDDIAGDLP